MQLDGVLTVRSFEYCTATYTGVWVVLIKVVWLFPAV